MPIPHWWLTQANDKLSHRDMTQQALVDAALRLRPAVEDASIDKGSVSRLLRGERTTWALAEAIRRVLDLPPFEFFAVDGDEAWRIVRLQQEYRKRRDVSASAAPDPERDLAAIETEIGLSDHPSVVQANDVPSGGKRKNSAEAGPNRRRIG